MRVGIYLIGNLEPLHWYGNIAAAVARQTLPGVEVCHLTDMNTRALRRATKIIRREKDAPMAVFRMQHHQAEGEWLFIDNDALVTRDITHVFSDPFDIAICERADDDGMKPEALKTMPHNMGVVFSRSPAFWAAAEAELRTYEDKLQEWMGDQLAVCRLIEREGFKTRIIPCTYNFPPAAPGMQEEAFIRHYKGKRKAWLMDDGAAILLRKTNQQGGSDGTQKAPQENAKVLGTIALEAG